MPLVFITVIQTIVIAITNIYTRYTVAVIASEEITEARPSLTLAVLWRFVSAITAVVITIAIPTFTLYVNYTLNIR